MKFHLPFLYTLLLGGCAAFLPSLDERTQSSYLDIPATPRLDSALGIPSTSSKTDISHIYLLNDAHEAFVARAALIESADHTLDLQYYIWHNDISGKLLFNLIHRAAERGVRVRLLLDDNNTNGMDDLLLALDNHPNIEVRLFNPFIFRKWRALGYVTDFPRLNRRMHNKSFTADNRATILGGRNIGDEYFKVNDDTIFADLDILATGRVVTEVSQDLTAIGQATPPITRPASSNGETCKKDWQSLITPTKIKTKRSSAIVKASNTPTSIKKCRATLWSGKVSAHA